MYRKRYVHAEARSCAQRPEKRELLFRRASVEIVGARKKFFQVQNVINDELARARVCLLIRWCVQMAGCNVI